MSDMTKRYLIITSWLLLIGIFVYIYERAYQQLYDVSFLSGWVLVSLILLLLAGSVSKKFFVKKNKLLLSKSHSYLGLFVAAVFMIHINFQLPSGLLETSMAVVFSTIIITGIIGFWIRHYYDGRLFRHEEKNGILNQIFLFRKDILMELEKITKEAKEKLQDEHFEKILKKYFYSTFKKVRTPLFTCLNNRRTRRKMHQTIQKEFACIPDEKKEYVKRLTQLVDKKHAVEYRYAVRSLLYTWMNIHIPLAFLLLFLIPLHMILVYTFID